MSASGQFVTKRWEMPYCHDPSAVSWSCVFRCGKVAIQTENCSGQRMTHPMQCSRCLYMPRFVFILSQAHPRFLYYHQPLHQLIQKNTKFCWPEEHTQSFNTLKHKLVQTPLFMYPEFQQHSYPFVVRTDASSVGLGAVLDQNEHVITYSSRALKKGKWHYSIIQKECLAEVSGSCGLTLV